MNQASNTYPTDATVTAVEFSSPETAEAVLDYLRIHPNPSVRQIGVRVGIGRNTAARAVRRLLAEDRIRITRKGTGAGYPTAYEVL